MHARQPSTRIVIADLPLPVAGGCFDIHHVTAANGGKSGARACLTRKQPRPVRREVEPRVREAEIFAQPAAAVAVRAVARARADDLGGLGYRIGAVADGIDDAHLRNSCHRILRSGAHADASSVVRHRAIFGTLAGNTPAGMNALLAGSAVGLIENEMIRGLVV